MTPYSLARLLSAGAVLALAGCAAPAAAPPATPAPQGTLPITAEAMRARIYFLASDALGGRDTPSPGLEAAAAYLASEAQRIGLRPAGEEGTFYQRWPFPLRRVSAEAARLQIAGPAGTQTLRWGRDFFAAGGSAAALEGALVFIGRELPQAAGNGAETLRDRVAVAALPGPGQADREWRLLRNRQLSQARAEGARALIHVLDPSITGEQLRQLAAQAATPARVYGEATAFPQFFVSYDAARRLFDAAGLALDRAWQQAAAGTVPPVALAGVRMTAAAPFETLDEAYPPNVVAMLPGSDPALRDEYVVLSAHFDHVGVGRPMNGDSIYNGADDNASGSSAILEIARALAALPTAPRRSVIFLWVSGEEKGLLGSRWYADNPTVPVGQIVANLNLDMVAGDAHRDSVVVIGKDYSTLGEVVNRVNARLPELNLIASDDIWPEQRFFFRSDQFNFMRHEIPALFFFTGVHECYHRPCDTVDFINPGKAARVANLAFHTVLEIANADQRPRWDPAGLEEVRSLTR